MAKVDQWLTEDAAQQIANWAKSGMSMAQIAKKIGINAATLFRWKKQYPTIERALSTGHESANAAVENALFKRAVGYTAQEVTQQRDTASGKLVVTKVVSKPVEPNVTAQLFWLKNRRADLWNERNDGFDGQLEVIFAEDMDKWSR